MIQAAGGVIWRDGVSSTEVLLIHRPHRDDWSLPKGKLDDGETIAECALREVEEETGYRCELGAELASTYYRDRKGRQKRVRYWTMTVVGGSFRPNAEVDEIRWLSVDQASGLLTNDRDTHVVLGVRTARAAAA